MDFWQQCIYYSYWKSNNNSQGCFFFFNFACIMEGKSNHFVTISGKNKTDSYLQFLF